jgi:hypothetical protein
MLAPAAGLAASALISGCGVYPLAIAFQPALGPLGAGMPAAPMIIAVGMAQPYGPTVTIDNQSDTVAEVRVWVATVDARKPEGFRDQHTADRMAVSVPGGEITKIQAGHGGWPTGQSDGVVWVRIDAGEGVHWFEFERPGPYRIEVRRAETDWFAPGPIVYLSAGGQAMTPLPESAWLEHHDGKYAITAPVTAPASSGS